jgi:hypothetical protein
MRIPDTIRKSVVYLGIEVSDGNGKKYWAGTGFFVVLRSEIIPNGTFGYLVTANHVAAHLKERGFSIRANSMDGKSIEIQIRNGAVEWFIHPTDISVDVAVCKFVPPNNLDYQAIPTTMILTESERQSKGIGLGDEVFVTGLFSYHRGTQKNIPIMRVGNIAMIPDERIPVKNFGPMEAYLVEMRSIGGLSGSPVFVAKQSDPKNMTMYLFGFIQGHFDIDSETIIDGTLPDDGTKAGVNVGIAIVTPASKILDILNSDELIASRRKSEADWLSRNSPISD